jgi:hypothetical protein
MSEIRSSTGQTFEGRVTVYELAERVGDRTLSLLDIGELALLHHAGQVRLTASMWKDCFVDSPAGIKVGAAIEAFSKEYGAFCKRHPLREL